MWSCLGQAKDLLLFYSAQSSEGKEATPKATSQGEQPITRTLELQGPRMGMLIPARISSGDASLFPAAREEAEANKKEVGCPSMACRHVHLLAK